LPRNLNKFELNSIVDGDGNDRVHAERNVPSVNRQAVAPAHPPPAPVAPVSTANHRPTPVQPIKKVDCIHRSTSPVDERVLQEFYADQPKDIHQYSLEGRKYVVYEGANLTDVETYKKGKFINDRHADFEIVCLIGRIDSSYALTRASRPS